MSPRTPDSDSPPGRNPGWFDDLLEYENRPLSKKLVIGVFAGLAAALLFFCGTFFLYKPVTARTAPAAVANPAVR
jgi:hypothetical protein